MIIEIVTSIIFIAYCVIGVVYSVHMEKDRVLKQVHKISSDHQWSERCFAFGFLWPLAPFINFVMRRRNT